MENTSQKKILIIDDEEVIRKLCKKALEKTTENIVLAASAEEGLAILDREKFHLILLDINLPGLSGLKALEKIKSKPSPETPEVVIITGKATITIAVEAMKLGAYDFITKPFEIYDLKAVVERAFEKFDLRGRIDSLQSMVAVYEIAKALSRLMPLEQLLNIVFDNSREAMSAEKGSLGIYNTDSGEIEIIVSSEPAAEEATRIFYKAEESIFGLAAISKEALLIDSSLLGDARFSAFDELKNIVTGISVPIISRDEVIGVINLERSDIHNPFNGDDLKLMSVFAEQAASAIQNARDYAKLKELDALKTEFIANVSHELRTPLQSILNAAEIFIKKDPDNKILQIMNRNAKRTRDLVEQLLDFSKLEKGEFVPQMEKASLSNMMSEAVEEISNIAEKKQIEIKIEFRDLPDTLFDVNSIRRVLLNLISNAIKYCPDGSVIIIDAAETALGLQVSVSDNGPGIPEEAKKNIFDSFYQQVPGLSLSAKHSGIGLGLSMVKKIVEAHRGRVWVDMRAGEGSTFFFTLPKS